jgi:hypothetical protein
MFSCFLLGLFFNPENGGDTFLQNVGWLSTSYEALYYRRKKSSQPPSWEPQILQHFTTVCTVKHGTFLLDNGQYTLCMSFIWTFQSADRRSGNLAWTLFKWRTSQNCTFFFYPFSLLNYKKIHSLYLSVLEFQLSTQLTDFREILYAQYAIRDHSNGLHVNSPTVSNTNMADARTREKRTTTAFSKLREVIDLRKICKFAGKLFQSVK